MNSNPDPDQSQPEAPPLGFWATVGSVAASFFGVQSQRNRERDFTRGKASHFIFIGLAMTVLLVVGLVVIVRVVLRQAGL